MPAREYAEGQIVADKPTSRLSDSEPSTGVRARGHALPAWCSPTLIGFVVCIALGFLSAATLPTLPSYDPFSWVLWGYEIAHHIIGPHVAFITGGGPSWKPFPVIFTTIFGFFGSVAPKLWVGLARGGGLFGVFIAYRLGSRLAATPRWRLAGPIGGVLSAFGVFLTSEWTHYMFRGTSEPLVVTATLFAIERHLAGRKTTAFLSGVALALMRPEAGLFVGLYALWLFFLGDPTLRTRIILVLGILAIPVGWFVPPWIASGQPFLSSQHALLYNGQLGAHPELQVLKRATNLSVWPVIVAAAAVTLLAIRKRDWLIVTLAGAALAYVAVVEAMTAKGYPGLERFMLPAAATLAVLAGVAVVRFALFAGGGLASLALAAVLVAIAVPFFAGRVSAAGPERGITQRAVNIYDRMVDAVRKAGGSKAVLPCPTSRAAINHSVQPSLAWALRAPLTHIYAVTDVDTTLRHPALAFFAPRNPINGGAPTQLDYGLRGQLITQAGFWKVIRITRPHDSVDACVGR
jgi:type II secretory pathway pseudopilin PulG